MKLLKYRMRLLFFFLLIELISIPFLPVIYGSETLKDVLFLPKALLGIVFWPAGPSILYFTFLSFIFFVLKKIGKEIVLTWRITHVLGFVSIVILIVAGLVAFLNDPKTKFTLVWFIIPLMNLIVAYIVFFYPFLFQKKTLGD